MTTTNREVGNESLILHGCEEKGSEDTDNIVRVVLQN